MSLKTLFTLVAPGALTLTACGMLLMLVPSAGVLAQAARGYPYVALSVAALLAWRMHRSRLLATALLLLLTHGALHARVFGAGASAAVTNAMDSAGAMAAASGMDAPTAMAAVLLPLLIAIIGLSSDHNIGTRHALLQLMLVIVPAGSAALLIAAAPADVRAVVTHSFIDPIYTDWTGLPQLALITALAGLGVLTALALYRERATDAGLGWAAFAGVLAMTQPLTDGSGTGRGLWMLAAGIILIIALVESSYSMAFHDELTGLPARRALSQTLASLRPPYTLAIVDVDHFKSFNDRYGHDVGDEVLRMVATRLAAVRGGGRAFRSGGEEFTLVFGGRTKAESIVYVEEVREAVAGARFALRKKPRPQKKEGESRRGTRSGGERRIGVTISVGLASVDGRNTTTDAVVKAADKAMYKAKKNGRNRVVA